MSPARCENDKTSAPYTLAAVGGVLILAGVVVLCLPGLSPLLAVVLCLSMATAGTVLVVMYGIAAAERGAS